MRKKQTTQSSPVAAMPVPFDDHWPYGRGPARGPDEVYTEVDGVLVSTGRSSNGDPVAPMHRAIFTDEPPTQERAA